jgi:uncharacterized protein YcfL
MKHKTNLVAGTLAVATVAMMLGLVGCSSTAAVVVTGKTAWDDEGARVLEKKVEFNNLGLKWDILIVDIRSVQAGDLMKVQATLRSRDKDTLPFQYRFEWYDAGGLEINSGAGSWKPLILNGRETKTVQAAAPDSRAKEFKLKIREPD